MRTGCATQVAGLTRSTSTISSATRHALSGGAAASRSLISANSDASATGSTLSTGAVEMSPQFCSSDTIATSLQLLLVWWGQQALDGPEESCKDSQDMPNSFDYLTQYCVTRHQRFEGRCVWIDQQTADNQWRGRSFKSDCRICQW